MKVKIHHEGTNIIVLLALALVAINVLLHFFAAKWLFITVLVISVILMCLVLNFFRLPHRHFESESPLDVVASVDGVVVALEEVLEEDDWDDSWEDDEYWDDSDGGSWEEYEDYEDGE